MAAPQQMHVKLRLLPTGASKHANPEAFHPHGPSADLPRQSNEWLLFGTNPAAMAHWFSRVRLLGPCGSWDVRCLSVMLSVATRRNKQRCEGTPSATSRHQAHNRDGGRGNQPVANLCSPEGWPARQFATRSSLVSGRNRQAPDHSTSGRGTVVESVTRSIGELTRKSTHFARSGHDEGRPGGSPQCAHPRRTMPRPFGPTLG